MSTDDPQTTVAPDVTPTPAPKERVAMADSSTVNPQITDAVTQANTEVLGDAPALALANLYQATAQALGMAAHNATLAQQSANTILQASTAAGVNLLYSDTTAGVAAAAAKTEEST
jgi:hypothetical protein